VLAAEIAAWTLPMFHDSWRSQFFIMAAVSVVATIVIATNIAELSPRLRGKVRKDEGTVIDQARAETPPKASRLLTNPRIIAHLAGVAMWLVLYITLAGFGQTMLAQTFDLSAAQASSVMSKFWMLNLATLILAGWLSDRLQVRKTFSVVGTLCAAGISFYLVHLIAGGVASTGRLAITGALLGGALGTAYGPWMASYSEDGESIEPRLQGTAWGAYSVLAKTTSIAVVLLIPVAVVDRDWTSWFTIATVCMVLFVAASLFFGGRWLPERRAAERESETQVPTVVS
jgi:sugar phosphate permease